QLQASFFRLLCLLPTGFPVRSVDMQRTTDNITIRQGDTAIISGPKGRAALSGKNPDN
ncbi:unnamed protein product, partial [Tetraodon nigroviridis]